MIELNETKDIDLVVEAARKAQEDTGSQDISILVSSSKGYKSQYIDFEFGKYRGQKPHHLSSTRIRGVKFRIEDMLEAFEGIEEFLGGAK
jgi:hypothetical protein